MANCVKLYKDIIIHNSHRFRYSQCPLAEGNYRVSHGIGSTCVMWFLMMKSSLSTTINNMADARRLSDLKVPELKKLLADRGISSQGKRRDQLLWLAGQAISTYDTLETCDHDQSERSR